MVLAFNSTGDFAKAVYGDSSAQHAGTNGGIATTNPSAPMTGGRRRRQRQSQRQQRQQRQRAGQSQRRSQSQRRQRQSQRRRRQSQRQQQNGGK